MLKAFKVMLLPNKKQRVRLFQFAGSARFAYNWALKKEMDAFNDGEKFISPDDLRKEFTRIRNSAVIKTRLKFRLLTLTSSLNQYRQAGGEIVSG